MTPEEQARIVIDEKLEKSGWTIQDMKKLNLTAAIGVAVREFPTSTGPVDYALFIDGKPVGVIEAKKSESGENITVVEGQSARYAHSTFKWVQQEYRIRFAYKATCSGKLEERRMRYSTFIFTMRIRIFAAWKRRSLHKRRKQETLFTPL